MIGNLLLVDDELDILEGLAELFKVELPEITVYQVNNARKGLELLDKIQFDVVLTDINMPKMDGIAMFKQIRESWPQCQVIFLTGYRDFDHLYEISQFEDVSYLLKSESDENLVKAVKSAFQNLSEMMSHEAEQDFQEEINAVQQKYLTTEMASRLIQNWQIEDSFLDEYTVVHHYEKERPLFAFFFQLDQAELNYSQRQQVEQHINAHLGEFFPSSLTVTSQWVSHSQGLILLQSQSDLAGAQAELASQYVKATGGMMYLQEKLWQAYGESVSFLISRELISFQQLGARYRHLLSLSYLQLSNSTQMIVKLEELALSEDLTAAQAFNWQKILSHLKSAIDDRESGDFDQTIGQILYFLLTCEQLTDRQTAYHGSMSLLYATLVKYNALQEEEQALFPAFESLPQAEAAILNLSKLVAALFDKKGEDERTTEIINRVKEYIKANLSEDLALVNLADVCFLNPAYLSRLFKQETGEKISDYIGRQRVKLAQEQLLNSQIKIKQIGINVGYITPHSFTRFFRKFTGMSPKEYRERNGGIHG